MLVLTAFSLLSHCLPAALNFSCLHIHSKMGGGEDVVLWGLINRFLVVFLDPCYTKLNCDFENGVFFAFNRSSLFATNILRGLELCFTYYIYWAYSCNTQLDYTLRHHDHDMV